ncbi:MAG: hypothetical protein KC609_07525 [Myxococcales bacterium]|nr:hypothetical protein [Myxococcales bacterium]
MRDRTVWVMVSLVWLCLAAGCGRSKSSVADQTDPDSVASDQVSGTDLQGDVAVPSDQSDDDSAEPNDLAAGDLETPDVSTDVEGDVEPPDTTPDASLKPTWLDDTTADFPSMLSEVGIYPTMTDRSTVDPRLVFYEPRFPLWTDGALKSRHIYLPPGTKIDNSTKQWSFPDGTALFKHFEFPGQPVETRILRKRNGQWNTTVYQWNSEGTEAMRVTSDLPISVTIEGHSDLKYRIPNSAQCELCHGTNATFIIGFDELRLNHKIDAYEKKQIEHFADLGMFEKPLPVPLEDVTGKDSATILAKGYLHGNCAHCHNAKGINSSMNLRHDMIEASVYNKPTDGGGTAGIRLVPKDPEGSTLFIATVRWGTDEGIKNMPFIGVSKTDPSLEKILSDWINGMCADSGDCTNGDACVYGTCCKDANDDKVCD